MEKNKRGISGVVVTVLLIAMAIGLFAIVWTVVNKIIEDRMDCSSACFGIMDKVELNQRYTCYDKEEEAVKFSISVGDIDIDDIIVSLEWEAGTLRYDKDDLSGEGLPEENAGKTYIRDCSEYCPPAPDVIKIAPQIENCNCGISSSVVDVTDCLE